MRARVEQEDGPLGRALDRGDEPGKVKRLGRVVVVDVVDRLDTDVLEDGVVVHPRRA